MLNLNKNHLKKLFLISLFTSFLPLWMMSQGSFKDTTVENLFKKFQYEEAVDYITSNLPKIPQNDFDKRLYYNTKCAMSYFRLMNVDSAIQYAIETRAIKDLSSDSSLIIEAVRTIGLIYNMAGDLNSSLLYTDELLKYAYYHQDTLLIRNALTTFGTILSENKRYEEAISYFNKAYQLTFAFKDTVSYASTTYNLGLTYLFFEKDSGYYYLNKAIPLAEKSKNIGVLLKIYSAMADYYLLQGDKVHYKLFLEKAKDLAAELDSPMYLAYGYSGLMRYTLNEKLYKETIEYGDKIYTILDSNPYPFLETIVDSMMYVAYRGLNNNEKALDYLEKSISSNDMIFNSNQEKSLNQMLLQFKTAEKDLQLAQQKLELTEKYRRIAWYYIIPLIILFSLMVILLLWRKRGRLINEIFRKDTLIDSQLEENQELLQLNRAGVEDESHSDSRHKSLSIRKNNLLYFELREAFEKQKLYLNPEINLEMTIKILGTNRRYLYEALRNSSDDNFRNFVNRYRINEAKRLIKKSVKNDENLNIPDISTNTGFNSIASFYRAFHMITGLSPKQYESEYRRNLHLDGNS